MSSDGPSGLSLEEYRFRGRARRVHRKRHKIETERAVTSRDVIDLQPDIHSDPPTKRSTLEKQMNTGLLSLFALLFVTCIVCAAFSVSLMVKNDDVITRHTHTCTE